MKFLPDNFVCRSRKAGRGFTIIELMIAATVFSLVVIATVALQIYASRVYTLASTKLNAATAARSALNDIRDTIRAGQVVQIGNYTFATGNPVSDFTPIADGSQQVGNAVIVYPSAANTTSFSLLFLQPGNGSTSFATMNSRGRIINTNFLILEVYANGALQQSNVVAGFITNQYVFQAQDYQNNILTNNVNNRVVQVQMYFAQWEYPIAFVGSNSVDAFDYYRVQTRISRRLVN